MTDTGPSMAGEAAHSHASADDAVVSTPPATIFSLLHRAFGDATMEAIFSERSTVDAWLRTEAELARAQATVGLMSGAKADAIAAACTLDSVDLGRLWRETANVGYPILPLVRQVTEHLAEADRGWLHYGATTQDIMDTGLSLQLTAAIDRLDSLTAVLGDGLAALIDVHAWTVMAARTHGQQAVPTTFGAKLATYLRQCQRLREDLAASRPRVCRVSLHGAAGTSAGMGAGAAAVRAHLARRLDLADADGPWHVARDGLAGLGAVCARGAALGARLAREVIDLSRTEIGEVAESGGHHRGASSTMPQKANPIDSEAIVGMAVNACASAGALFRAMEAGHERSAGEWQVEWHALPQAATLAAGCLLVAGRVVRGLRVDPGRMVENLALEQGRTVAEAYMFHLAPSLGRERAHDLLYAAATASKSRHVELRDALVDLIDGEDGSDPVVDGIPDIAPGDYLGDAVAEARGAVESWRRLGEPR